MRTCSLTWLAAALLTCAGSAAASPASNSLTWRVSDEKAVFGYIVYRAEHREGPFRRANKDIIRKNGKQADAGQYRFDDGSLEAGKTYYYFIDVISEYGRKQRLSGVRSKTAASEP